MIARLFSICISLYLVGCATQSTEALKPIEPEIAKEEDKEDIVFGYGYEALGDRMAQLKFFNGEFLSDVKRITIDDCDELPCPPEDGKWVQEFDKLGRIIIESESGRVRSKYTYLLDSNYPSTRTTYSKDGRIFSHIVYGRDGVGNIAFRDITSYISTARTTRYPREWTKHRNYYEYKDGANTYQYVDGHLAAHHSGDDEITEYSYKRDAADKLVSVLQIQKDRTFRSKNTSLTTVDEIGRITKISTEIEGNLSSRKKEMMTYENDARGNWILRKNCADTTWVKDEGEETELRCTYRSRKIEYHS